MSGEANFSFPSPSPTVAECAVSEAEGFTQLQIRWWNRPTRVCLQELTLNNCFDASRVTLGCEAKTEKAGETCHVWIKEMSESEPIEEASRKLYILSKPRCFANLGMNIAVTCLLAMWQSLFRGHEFYLGLFVERRKPFVDAKGKQ